jgi:hypothetical protein
MSEDRARRLTIEFPAHSLHSPRFSHTYGCANIESSKKEKERERERVGRGGIRKKEKMRDRGRDWHTSGRAASLR